MVKWTREALMIGDFSLRYYGMLIALGALLGVLLAMKREKRLGLARDTAIDLSLVGVPCALIGARLYYVVFSWDFYKNDPWKIFSLREGGMAIYGGVLAGVLVGWAFSRARKVSFWSLADLAAPSLALGQAIGRWGNFFNQEAYGYEVSPDVVPWAMYIDGAYRHPTFLYESIWDIIGFFLLILASRSPKLKEGDIALLYFVYYSVGRFIIEGFRTDSLMLGPLRMAQVVCIVAIVASIVIAALRRKKAPSRAEILEIRQRKG